MNETTKAAFSKASAVIAVFIIACIALLPQ
jgi:hypothetical protein